MIAKIQRNLMVWTRSDLGVHRGFRILLAKQLGKNSSIFQCRFTLSFQNCSSDLLRGTCLAAGNMAEVRAKHFCWMRVMAVFMGQLSSFTRSKNGVSLEGTKGSDVQRGPWLWFSADIPPLVIYHQKKSKVTSNITNVKKSKDNSIYLVLSSTENACLSYPVIVVSSCVFNCSCNCTVQSKKPLIFLQNNNPNQSPRIHVGATFLGCSEVKHVVPNSTNSVMFSGFS